MGCSASCLLLEFLPGTYELITIVNCGQGQLTVNGGISVKGHSH